MIGNITGNLIATGPDWVLIQTSGGVGYKIFVTKGCLLGIAPGQPITLFTHLVVREDQLSLYGFATEAELNFFVQLLTISGVGPRVALSILGASSVNDLKAAVASNNLAVLTMISGVGKKTAERIMVELKNRLDIITNISSADAEELLSALTGLGYNAYEVRQILSQLPKDLTSTEDKLKYALQFLGKK